MSNTSSAELGFLAQQAIQDKYSEFRLLAQKIWENPEPGFEEYFAAEETALLLEELGFTVERGTAGVPTAIKAVWGEGQPVVGLLGEYDALPGLSQEPVAYESPIEGQAYGHGCGHNLIAAGHVAAAYGIKEELRQSGRPGTVVFYGCPAEELGVGKGMMADGGAFRELDFALAFHPFWSTYAFYDYKNGSASYKATFTGVSCHFGSIPYLGRNAANPAQLSILAMQMIRDELPPMTRIMTQMRDLGTRPGVGETVEVIFAIRGRYGWEMAETRKRLEKVVQAMADITETTVELELIGGVSPLINNRILTEELHQALLDAPVEEYTEEELEYARAINRTAPENLAERQRVIGTDSDTVYITPREIQSFDTLGCTDVGDVSYLVPTAFCKVGTEPLAGQGHKWQATSASNSSLSFKGTIYAAKALALASLRVMNDPEKLAAIKAGFAEDIGDYQYESFVPENYPMPERKNNG